VRLCLSVNEHLLFSCEALCGEQTPSIY